MMCTEDARLSMNEDQGIFTLVKFMMKAEQVYCGKEQHAQSLFFYCCNFQIILSSTHA